MKEINPDSVKEYYNKLWFDKRLNKINTRHKSIFINVLQAGFKENFSVLEVGCGYGLLSDLVISKLNSKGRFTGIDISDDSINFLNDKYKDNPNVSFYSCDLKLFSFSEKFDFIIFPDVLEHIPLNEHDMILENFRGIIKENTLVLVNNPSPFLLDFARIYNPSTLQIIDQPLYFNYFSKFATKLELELVEFKEYSLFHKHNDFQNIVFKTKQPIKFIEKSYLERLLHRIRINLKFALKLYF